MVTTQRPRTRTPRSTGAARVSGGNGTSRAHGVLDGSVGLRAFLQTMGTLTLQERRRIVEQALVMLEQNYVHLPLKVAMHGVNPVQRLRLLAIRLERQDEDGMDPELRFHAELSEIFHSLRDLHTNYLLPAPFAGQVAYQPFLVEEYYDPVPDGAARHYVVSHVAQGFSAPGFGPGAELTYWNGMPIERAVEENAARYAGSNDAARHARGVESLTIRPLIIHLPPAEEWVDVTYLGTDGVQRELRQEWMVAPNLPPFTGDDDVVTATAASLAVDLDSHAAGRAKARLFAPHAIRAATATGRPGDAGSDIPTTMPGVFRARSVTTDSGVFGHLRIFTFGVQDPAGFVRELIRLMSLLPQDGLILDVRDNGGGHIHASEFTLQTLTPRPITPEPVQFVTMPLNLRICRKHQDNPTGQIDLGPWVPSLDRARQIGAAYSDAVPITPLAGANEIGQRYHGPVVLITNARCYSATDIFAAGFADHRIGPILGVDDNTGAGGANVWTHGLLKALLETAPADADSPYRPLPKGANLRVAIRRTLRVGDSAGVPVEDLGVRPDVRHAITRRDVLERNADLLERAGELLAAMPVRALALDVVPDGGSLQVDIAATNVDLAVVHLDGVPRTSVDVSAGTGSVRLHRVGANRVRVDGYAAGALVASRTVALEPSPPAVPAAPAAGTLAGGARPATIVYVHGAGNKPAPAALKGSWDRDLFGRDLGDESVLAYYADLLHARPAAIAEDACSVAEALTGDAGNGIAARDGDAADLLAGLSPRGQQLALGLSTAIAARPGLPAQPLDGLLPFPWLRQEVLKRLLRRLIPDADAYFFGGRKGQIRDRLRRVLRTVDGPLVVVAHSLGTVVAYDVLSEREFADRDVRLLVTLGCPLGYTEIQDVVARPLRVPAGVRQWLNVADPLDVIALDTTLADEFSGGRLVDVRVNNPAPNNHAPCGYLATAQVRAAVTAAVSAG